MRRDLVTLWTGVVAAAAIAGGPLAAQPKLDPKQSTSYFDAMPIQQDDAPVRQLLAAAEAQCGRIEELCPPGEELLRLLFQGSYRDDLPDFIVRLVPDPESGRHLARKPMMIFNRRNTPYLLGVEHVWVLVFADAQISMTAQLTTIEEREANPFTGIFGVFGVDSAGGGVAMSTSSKEEKALVWRPLAGVDDESPLWVGSARLPIANDIISRLTLTPDDVDQVDFHSITAHISNSRSSFAAFSTGFGATFGTDDTGLGETGGDPHFNGYALAKFYFPGRLPRLDVSPVRRARFRRSIGLVFGTNVTNDPFEEIVVGLSFGHLVGKAGLVVGGNAVKALEGDNREWRPFLGVDFTF